MSRDVHQSENGLQRTGISIEQNLQEGICVEYDPVRIHDQ